MKAWLKFYFLGFFNDKFGKEAVTRNFLNIVLSMILAIVLFSGGITAGYAASFGKHYGNAADFRACVYSAFGTDNDSRVNLSVRDGKLSADKIINDFGGDGSNSVGGYKLVVDTRPAATTFDDFKLICKDANGVEISYEDYSKLPEDGRNNGSVVFEYSGVALDVTVKQAEYTAYLDMLSDESNEKYNGDIAAAYGELKHKKTAGEISDKEYADEIYTLYARSYYPSYLSIERYGKAPTLRTYYLQNNLVDGEDKYLIMLDDTCICSFETDDGTAVDFASYYTGVADGDVSAQDMSEEEMRKNIDSFISSCCRGSGGLIFLVYVINTFRLVLPFVAIMLVLALIVFGLCKLLHLRFGAKYNEALKITGGYLFYSAVVCFIAQFVLSFFIARNTVFAVSEALLVSVYVLRAVVLTVMEFIREKRGKYGDEQPEADADRENK